MITKTIIKVAEKAMPFEEKFKNKLERFFGKHAYRLLVSGITALVCTWLIYEISGFGLYGGNAVLLAVIGFIDLTAIGAFFANLKPFSMGVFGVSVGIASVLLYLLSTTINILSGIDLTMSFTNEEIASIVKTVIVEGIIVCAVATVVTILVAKLVVGNKKRA